MSIFEKVAQADKLIKESAHKKEAFLGRILSFVAKRPLQAVTTALDAKEVSDKASLSNQAVRNAKNRAHLTNNVSRV